MTSKQQEIRDLDLTLSYNKILFDLAIKKYLEFYQKLLNIAAEYGKEFIISKNEKETMFLIFFGQVYRRFELEWDNQLFEELRPDFKSSSDHNNKKIFLDLDKDILNKKYAEKIIDETLSFNKWLLKILKIKDKAATEQFHKDRKKKNEIANRFNIPDLDKYLETSVEGDKKTQLISRTIAAKKKIINEGKKPFKSQVAKRLNIPRTTYNDQLSKYDIDFQKL